MNQQGKNNSMKSWSVFARDVKTETAWVQEIKKFQKMVGAALGSSVYSSKESLIVLIHRKGDVIVPRGSTIIEADDRLLVLAEKSSVDFIEKLASSRL